MSEKNKSESVWFTTAVNKYPSFRDHPLKGVWRWLEGRRADDNAEGLWRVHDKLYDLKAFVKNHPGGPDWLNLTMGTDITEAFETYHIRGIAEKVLQSYYVRDASEPRNYRFTYDENGFFKTVKRRAAAKLATADKSSLWKSKLILDLNVLLMFVATIMTVRVESLAFKLFWGLIGAQSMSWLNAMAHNFIHQRDNWRMNTAYLVLTGWRDWRVYHGLSHHLYPNTYSDYEISGLEPTMNWMPMNKKSRLSVIVRHLVSPFFFAATFQLTYASRWLGYLLAERQPFRLLELIPLLVFTPMYVLGKYSFWWTFLIWQFMIMGGSFLYMFMAVNAGHHGPRNVHEGDEFKSLDYGIYQLAATIDRYEARTNLFMSLTHFGDHILHHLFPALDHSLLPQFRELALETCVEYQEELRECSLLEAFVDQIKQLSRTETIKIKNQ